MNATQGFGQRVSSLSANQGPAVLGGRGRGGRHHRGRLRLGRLGHRRQAKRMAEAAAAGAHDTLVAAVCVDRFQAGGDAQAQLAALKLLQSYDRGSFIEKGGWAVMPDKASASSAAMSALRRPAGGPLASSAARPGAVTPGPRSNHRVDRCRLGRSIRACRCARWRNPRDEPGRSGPLGEATWPRRASRISSTWRPR